MLIFENSEKMAFLNEKAPFEALSVIPLESTLRILFK
jgi:hypothetical protein